FSSLSLCLLEYVDAELELSMVRHQPEGLEKLQAQTKFTRKELQSLYRGFKNECPSGLVDEETFKVIYSQFFPQGAAETGRLVKIEGKMNVAMYRNILDVNLLQSALDFGLGRRFIFQQDNNPKHTAKITK
ncbi:hypothetical protein QTP70_025274, partial [Hemibagrus guttatus]